MASKLIEYRGEKFEISYEILNLQAERDVIFLHGWGSNKEIMKQAFGGKFKGFREIYIDLPGFGRSPNSRFLTTHDYSEIVKLFLQTLKSGGQILVGHSFGGKVATLINPDCLILLSSAGISIQKSIIVKAKIAIFKLLNRVGLSKFRELFVSSDAKGMNEGMYETFKYVVNEDFEPNFHKVTGKTVLFWGDSDSATPLWSGKKIASIIEGSKLYILDGNHYFFIKHSESIADTIQNLCK